MDGLSRCSVGSAMPAVESQNIFYNLFLFLLEYCSFTPFGNVNQMLIWKRWQVRPYTAINSYTCKMGLHFYFLKYRKKHCVDCKKQKQKQKKFIICFSSYWHCSEQYKKNPHQHQQHVSVVETNILSPNRHVSML